MYDSGTEGDLILWLIHYYLTLRITKSQTNLLLGFTWKHRHLLWYDTPPADSMPSKFFPPWPATCRFCEPSENSTTCSFSTKACHLQFLKSRPPADYFAFSNFSTKACHLHFLNSVCHPKAPPPAVLKTPPPAAAQMGKSLCMQQGEPAVSIMVQQHHSVSRLAFQMQPLGSDTFKLCIREHANIEKYMSWNYRIYSWFNSQQLEMIIWDE